MDRKAWQATVYRRRQSQTGLKRLSTHARTPYAEDLGLCLGQGTRSCTLQLKIPQVATKIPHDANKTQHSQINFFSLKCYLKNADNLATPLKTDSVHLAWSSIVFTSTFGDFHPLSLGTVS